MPATPTPPRDLLPSTFWKVSLLGIVVLLLPHVALWSLTQVEGAVQPELKPVSTLSSGWQATARPWIDWAPEFQNPSATLNQTFTKHGAEVGLYIGYYRHQNQERKLVSSSNALVRTSNTQWAQVGRGGQHVKLSDQRSLALNTAELRGSGSVGALTSQRMQVWQTYWINGKWTSSDMLAKAYGAMYRLMGRGDDGAVLTFYTEKGTAKSDQAALVSFVRENLPLIEAQLQHVRDNQ